jgi:acetylornithine deacetylase/succinyl-diaminopimelate desuccinylase-like protein
VFNPIQALAEMIAHLHDARGRIAIPGFYDSVRRWSADERAFMARSSPPDAHILRDAGATRGWGERGYTAYERIVIRPALTINGISGGYQGPGGKGIIPARASAKLSFRLVPDQQPEQIERLFRAHLARIASPHVRITISAGQPTHPALIDRGHPALRAAAVAYKRGFGAEPVFLRSGGSIPVVNLFDQILGVTTALMGFALPDDRMHAPNEKFDLSQFSGGIATCMHFLAGMSRNEGRGVGA